MFNRFFNALGGSYIISEGQATYGEKTEKFHKFVKVQLPHHDIKPSKILALDIDDTLLAIRKSRDEKKTCILNKHEIKHIFLTAKKKNIMLVLVTSRFFLAAKAGRYSLPSVLMQLGASNFSFVFFTNGEHKNFVLEHLHSQYFNKKYFCQKSMRDKICLIDNDIGYLEPCDSLGFDTILVDAENKYLQAMRDFIKDLRPLVIPKPIFLLSPETEDELSERLQVMF